MDKEYMNAPVMSCEILALEMSRHRLDDFKNFDFLIFASVAFILCFKSFISVITSSRTLQQSL